MGGLRCVNRDQVTRSLVTEFRLLFVPLKLFYVAFKCGIISNFQVQFDKIDSHFRSVLFEILTLLDRSMRKFVCLLCIIYFPFNWHTERFTSNGPNLSSSAEYINLWLMAARAIRSDQLLCETLPYVQSILNGFSLEEHKYSIFAIPKSTRNSAIFVDEVQIL